MKALNEYLISNGGVHIVAEKNSFFFSSINFIFYQVEFGQKNVAAERVQLAQMSAEMQ